MAIGDLNVRIGATIQGLQQGLKTAERELNRFANKTNALGNSLTLGVSLPLAGLGAAAVKAFADFESLELGLTAITGSAEEAGKQLDRLRKIALQPSVNLEQAVKASVQLQTVGFNAEQAENAISQFAKAATLSGAGAEGLAAIVKQITQINSKGRILQEDIGIILENVPSVGIAIKDAFGDTSVEAIRASGVSAREFTDTIIQAIEQSEQFQAAQGGLSTQIENFGIALKESLVVLGKSISESINLGDALEKLAGFVAKAVDSFKNMTPEMQRTVVQIGLLLLSIGPVIKGVSLLVSGVTALLNPMNLIIVAVVALAAGFIYAYNNSEKFRGSIFALGAAAGEIFKILGEAAAALAKGFKQVGEGDFGGAVSSFGEFIKKGNPIGIAITEGERLAKAYRDGFAKGVGAEELSVQDLVNKVTGGGGAKGPILDLSGAGGKKEKFKPQPLEITGEIIPTLALGSEGLLGQSAEAVARTTEAFKQAFAEIPETIRTSDQSLQGFLTRVNEELTPVLLSTVEPAQSTTQLFQDLALTFERIDQQAAIFGDTSQALKDKLSALKEAINVAVEEGNITAVAALTEQYNDLANSVALVGTEINEVIERGKRLTGLSVLKDVFGGISDEIIRTAKAGETSFARLGAAALRAAADVVRAKLIEAVVAYAADAFKKLGIFGVFLAAAAGGVVGAIFTKLVTSVGVPAFAEGGIVTGPTVGLVGEAGPEAIIPLRKFDQVVGGMQSGELVARVSGDDLYLIYQRAAQRKGRIG